MGLVSMFKNNGMREANASVFNVDIKYDLFFFNILKVWLEEIPSEKVFGKNFGLLWFWKKNIEVKRIIMIEALIVDIIR